MADEDTNISRSSTMNNSHENDDDDNNNTASPEKRVEGMTDDQYPHGYKLVLLAGAAIIAVFLIALDQVRTPFSYADTARTLLTPKASRPSSARQYPRLRTSSMA